MKTSYFSLGNGHLHKVDGQILDTHTLIKITSEDPRKTMFETFGSKWCFEYPKLPEMRYFPKGVYDLTNRKMVEE